MSGKIYANRHTDPAVNLEQHPLGEYKQHENVHLKRVRKTTLTFLFLQRPKEKVSMPQRPWRGSLKPTNGSKFL